MDIRQHEFRPTHADEFQPPGLREPSDCDAALTVDGGTFDEVYQLAADMGGMGFIHAAECEITRNSMLINVHMTSTAAKKGVPPFFYSSSACVYRDQQPDEPTIAEEDSYPALPDNEYGWEKLYGPPPGPISLRTPRPRPAGRILVETSEDDARPIDARTVNASGCAVRKSPSKVEHRMRNSLCGKQLRHVSASLCILLDWNWTRGRLKPP